MAAASIAAVAAVVGCGGGSPSTTGSSTGPEPQPHGVGGGAGGVRLEKLGDFEQPLYVTQPPGDSDHLFVVEQTGRVQVLTDGTREAKPFLDLSGQVSCCGEQGLLSIAFSPDYRRSGLVYADYTDGAGDTRVVEFRRSDSDPLTVDPASARLVLRVDQPFPNHNGGLLLFGPDHLLYVGLGDGGSEGDPDRNGQDLGTLLGKILRIDPRPSGGRPYSVPPSNPFVDTAGARPEIYTRKIVGSVRCV